MLCQAGKETHTHRTTECCLLFPNGEKYVLKMADNGELKIPAGKKNESNVQYK